MKISLYVSKVEIAIPEHMSKVQGNKFGKHAAQTWKKFQDPYVPMQEGGLANSDVIIKPWAIWHHSVYAHYQYAGLRFNHNVAGQKHPKATAEWDKHAWKDKKDDYIAAMQEYVDSGALGFGK